MILDISTILSSENGEEEKEVHIDMESFASKMGVFPVLKSKPFTLRLSNVENRQLLIHGETDVTVAIPCDRCLTEVPVKLCLVIDKTVPIERKGPGEEASGDDPQQREYLEGCRLDVERLIYGEMLVAWPMKVLCKEDCKGICEKCGTNLNQTDCGCDRWVPDPRMAAFQDVFNKFKEV